MIKLICSIVLVLGSIFNVSTALANDCPKIIFYGETTDHKKEVFVCLVSPSELQYFFGKVRSGDPEVSFSADPSTASWGDKKDGDAILSEITLINGDLSYVIKYGYDHEGDSFAGIEVYKDYKRVSLIPISPSGYIGNTIGLRNTDIPETDDL